MQWKAGQDFFFLLVCNIQSCFSAMFLQHLFLPCMKCHSVFLYIALSFLKEVDSLKLVNCTLLLLVWNKWIRIQLFFFFWQLIHLNVSFKVVILKSEFMWFWIFPVSCWMGYILPELGLGNLDTKNKNKTPGWISFI